MSATNDAVRTAFRTCPLCEAGCGLEITLKGDEVIRIRGDRDDVFSHGFICPKGSTLKQLHEDPDRVRQPLVKRDGQWVSVSWAEAFAEIERRLLPIVQEHGREALGIHRREIAPSDPAIRGTSTASVEELRPDVGGSHYGRR